MDEMNLEKLQQRVEWQQNHVRTLQGHIISFKKIHREEQSNYQMILGKITDIKLRSLWMERHISLMNRHQVSIANMENLCVVARHRLQRLEKGSTR